MKKSDNIGELSKALTAFQSTVPQVTKNKTVKSGAYSYKYADLASIWSTIKETLRTCALSILQMPSTYQGETHLTTIIMHSSGEWIEDTMKLNVTQETPQGQGSAITYARRYMLCSALGIVADDDTDAHDHQPFITPDMKRQLAAAAYSVVPDLKYDPTALVNFIRDVVGTEPGKITRRDFRDAIATIQAYTYSDKGDKS